MPLPALNFIGFSAHDQWQFRQAAELLLQLVTQNCAFPDLRANTLSIVKSSPPPRHVADPPPGEEWILISCEENKPYQFMYQFAHELGHAMALSHLRFFSPNPHHWIEEAICGAYSLHCLRKVSLDSQSPFQVGASEYCKYLDDDYRNPETITPTWYATNRSELVATRSLTELVKPVSRMIVDSDNKGQFVTDNVALGTLQFEQELPLLLEKWAAKCKRDNSLPCLLRDRLGLASEH